MPLAFLQLLRVQNFPSALADVWAGYFLHLSWGGTFSLRDLALLSLASLQVYGAGMALNDFVDYTRDLILHPGRPLPSGRVRQGDALIAAALLMVGASLCAMLVSPIQSGICFGLVLLVLAYDLWTKSRRWTGAVNMGLLRAGNLLLGLGTGVAAAVPGAGPWLFPALLGGHVFLVTLLSTYEEDPLATAAARTVFGAQLAVLALPVVLLPWRTAGPWLAAGLFLWFLALGVRGLRRSTTQAIPRLVVGGIRGIIVLDAAFVLAQGETALGLVVLSLLVPALTLGLVFRGS